jgi:hypothetical protein
MWARVKGKTENDLLKLPFKAAYMFRPGLMKPVDGQRNIKKIFHFMARLYPVLKFLSPGNACKLEHLGLTMISVSLKGNEKHVLGNLDITREGMKN